MAKNDQNEFPLPNGSNSNKRESARHLPKYFRTDKNQKFLKSTLDQVLQPGVAEKISSYVGRKTAKSFLSTDNYLSDISSDRTNYQLEPASIIQDSNGNVDYYADYRDYINQIANLGGSNNNHGRNTKEEFYSWDPHIDWDKFTNFREYYWLPNGPRSVFVPGEQKEITSTYKISLSEALGDYSYVFTPDGLSKNPILKLYRGVKYIFEIDTPGFPITFKTQRTIDDSFLLVDGISAQKVENGIIELELGTDSPEELFYTSENDINLGGLIRVANQEDSQFIDVNAEIIGKKNYTTRDDWTLTNGLKVRFRGDVQPEQYRDSEWYVEGVGDEIKLISALDVEVSFPVGIDVEVPFDADEGFDQFPFSQAIGYPENKDYITINRASPDGNFWSRYNRWFHKDVIELVDTITNNTISIDQTLRASRPIIEFEAGLKLYNFGTKSKGTVDLIDTFTTDAFSTIEGSLGYNIDNIQLSQGMRVVFLADTDPLVNSKIFEVKFIQFKGSGTDGQLTLVPAEDSEPAIGENILVTRGTENGGKVWYYDGSVWQIAQEKTKTNVSPIFDVFDENDISYSNTNTYPASSFRGNKIFSYRENQLGVVDSELDFGLSYKSIENVGDIVFDFNFNQESFQYQINESLNVIPVNQGFLRKYRSNGTFEVVNIYTKANVTSEQRVILQYVNDNTRTQYPVNCFDRSAELTDLKFTVLCNNEIKYEGTDYECISGPDKVKNIKFKYSIPDNASIIIKCSSAAIKNNNGYYEIANNLEKNPLNEDLVSFTLGEVNDHVFSITENVPGFLGKFPGSSNLRDLDNLSKYGRKFIKHSSPLNLSMYSIIDKPSNIINATRYSKKEYAKFKRQFIESAESIGFTGSVKNHVNKIISEIVKSKTNVMPFYFSDMVPFGTAITTKIIVEDTQAQFYALNTPFTLNELSTRAVTVYKNDVQLLHNRDYTYNTEGFLVITATKEIGDIIEINEYDTTNGSFIPPTPSKLGLYPIFEPKIFQDNTFSSNPTVIRGHDGSIVKAFGDYRDDLILDLETRIFNNIKVQYDPALFNIHSYIPGLNRNTSFTRDEVNSPLTSDFLQWMKLVDKDYTTHNYFDRDNTFTFNYSLLLDKNGDQLPGWWRAIYRYYFDTDTPHTTPWEMLGFSIKPTWWETQYGPAPYTKNNSLMWEDLEKGIIRKPNEAISINKLYCRPGLKSFIPVDASGNLLGPSDCNIPKRFDTQSLNSGFVFGDGGPVEDAWINSSEYPFAILTSWLINSTPSALATGFDRSRQVRNAIGHIVYKDTKNHITLKDICFPTGIDNADQKLTSGFVNYIQGYMAYNLTNKFIEYQNNLKSIKNKLAFKLGGFTDKSKFKLILDSRTPTNQGNVFIPEENYQIFLNTSTPITTISYSGVIVEKVQGGFAVRGYDNELPYFNYYQALSSAKDIEINIGGISDSFISWNENRTYAKESIIEYNGSYFRATSTFTSSSEFDTTNLVKLPKLPVTGGRDGVFKNRFNTDNVLTISYGTILTTIQDVIDFLLGYEHWLIKQGFRFQWFDGTENIISDWKNAAREFMFWTSHSWGDGALIALSPAADQVWFTTEYTKVDSVTDNFFGYGLLKSDGKPLESKFLKIDRIDRNNFKITPTLTADGVYSIKIPLTQTEHIVMIDNTSVFGDVVYQPATGYRQDRIKAFGYRTTDWNGSLDIPGFIYSEVTIRDWEQWTDYAVGDIVKYKEFNYAADQVVPGSETFDYNQWTRLTVTPESKLMPNFEYKVNQFADFYDLDTDNFDVTQQQQAQHLIGYQKRKYLENIINDEVSQYKFYQGMINEKGTRNSLDKLFDVLSANDRESLDFYEEWAIKQGQYGASEGFNEVEFRLDEKKFKLNPQPIKLTNGDDVEGLVYNIKDYEVYKKPLDYTNTFLPSKQDLKQFTRSPGFVNLSDVKTVVANYNDLLNLDIDTYNNKDYIWVGSQNNSWNVLQYYAIDTTIISIETLSNKFSDTSATYELQLELDNSPTDIKKGDVIGIFNIQVDDNENDGSTETETNNTKLSPLNGFYKVSEKQLNKVYLESNIQIEKIAKCQGLLTGFKSVKVSDYISANKLTQESVSDGSLVWIENSKNDWKVLKNKQAYNLLQKIPAEETGDSNNYGSSIALDGRNSIMSVASPTADSNGKLFVYSRGGNSQNYQFTQIVEGNTATANNSGQLFGTGQAISLDGKYLVVGAPGASNVKSRYKGEYQESADYDNTDIVQYDGLLWEVVVDIQGAQAEQLFGSFGSIAEVLQNNNIFGNEAFFKNMLTGNYPFTTSEDNAHPQHILVRAPADQYSGTTAGDVVYMEWNEFTSANQDRPYTTGKLPFNNEYPAITQEFLESGLTIQKKVDVILEIPIISTVPQIGAQVESTGVFGYVNYVYVTENRATIYIERTNGSWPLLGQLFLESGEVIGAFERAAPTDTIDVNAELGGYWFFDTGADIELTANNVDEARGLVVYNVVPTGQSNTNAFGANIWKYNNTESTVYGANSENSYIRTLTYIGTPGPNNELDPILSDLFVVRAPKQLTDNLTVGDEVGLEVLRFPSDADGSFIDITPTGLTYQNTNKKHTLYDLWDGYIDFDLDETNSVTGQPFEPKVGQFVRERTPNPGATAKVAFYQKFNNSKARVYVTDVSGTWGALGTNRNIEYIGDPNDPDPVYNQDQLLGDINAVSLGDLVGSNLGIGKLCVFQLAEEIETVPVQSTIVGAEYIIYKDTNIVGQPLLPNVPSSINLDYKQVFKIPVDPDAPGNSLSNFGYFSVFEKQNVSSFNPVGTFIVPDVVDNLRLGSKIKIAKRNDLYKLLISAEGEGTLSNPGKIFFINKGTDDEGIVYDWETSKDKRYKGVFSTTTNYIIDDYVYHNGYFYQALTNIAGDGSTFIATEWSLVNNDQIRSIDYLGYIPNDTNTVPEDLDYKGFFNTLSTYVVDEIVQYFNGDFYRAKRSIPLGYNGFVDTNGVIEVPSQDWELINFVPGGDNSLKLDQNGLIEFGREFDISDNGEVLIVSAKFNNGTTKVVVYRNINDNYQKTQELIHPSIDETDSEFGTSISISQDGKMIAIGAPIADDSSNPNIGQVYVYTQIEDTFVMTQTLSSANAVEGEMFGKKIEFDGLTLYVSAFNASSDDITTFDSNGTVFDNEFTTFKNEIASNGVIYVYERIDEELIFGQTIDYHTYAGRDNISEVDFFGRNIIAKNNHVYVSVPRYKNADGKTGLILDYRRPDNERIWTEHRSYSPPADLSKIKRVMIYDSVKNEIITNLDYIDPLQGKIAGPADEEIRYKTTNDPATYTNDISSTKNVVINPNRSWGPEQVGRVWWDLTNAKFYNVYQSNLIYKTNNFNTLFEGASIDVYEWVESKLTPAEWNTASQEGGSNITGTSRYDAKVYSVRKVYDEIAKKFTTYYYYWVKDKTTVPNVPGRSLSIDSVAKLIADPTGQKYKFISFADSGSFVLHNVGDLIKDTDVVLNIQYWTSGDKYSNIHNQYQIVTEGLATSIPTDAIVNKLIDSLVGYDSNNRQVPNPNLSPKEKYGILNRPRQSWFINRVEVLKQVVERVNSILQTNLIADEKDISDLQLNDEIPTISTNRFDTTVDNVIDLNFVSTVRAKTASLTPIIENGKIVRVDIVDGGRSYKTAPTYTINGQGSGAEFEFTLDVLGQITNVNIINQGLNYGESTTIDIRPFAVLVNADETVNNKWAIYHYINNSWTRVASQAYDVTAYWNYTDWYATNYNKFTEVNHVLDYTYNLQELDDSLGDIVKILNVGGTGWLLLEKINNEDTTDYTVNYKTIGKENGTVQLSPALYSFADNLVGFDNQTFDTQFFDKQPVAELRIILNTLKDKIFIANLASEFNNIFFLCLRYVFTEQGYVDWAFKTSFVKAQHNVGELRQKTTFKNDNLTSYEDYISEVKPYKSNVREYVSNYSKLETASNVITDFDSPPRYDSDKGVITTADIKVLNGVLFGTGNALDIDSNWLNNLSYEVTKIEISDAGEGYITAPEIIIDGNATAIASLGPKGNIASIVVTDVGSGYIELPTITINGTLKDGGRDAKVTAVLGNSPVRNMHTIIKFDRVSGTFLITQLNETEIFTASGARSRFDLKWPMDLRINTVDITVNGELVLSSDYTFSNVKDTNSTPDKFFGRIEFINPPANEATIQVNYKKSIDLLDAQDRINLFYNPTTGQLGKDISQLMDGVDYGGIQVKSFEFGAPPGWDTGDWYTDNWDVYDESFDDETFETDGSTLTFDLVKPLAKDVKYNVYINGQRVDDDTWDGTSSVEGNKYAFMAPVIGDGTTSTFTFENEIRYRQVVEELDSSGFDNPPANVITLRRATSDGSRAVSESAYDTAITGGDLAYSTATGLSSEDISVDGDGFVTINTSKGPEETVPGQVMDTLDLQVYERPTSGTGVIEVDNFKGDGTTTVYKLTQRPYSAESVFVKVNYSILDNSKYAINFTTNEVTIYEAPVTGANISIISISLGGTNLLDYGEFTTDASTVDYETAIPYSDSNSAYVTVNGNTFPFTLEDVDGVTHIKFAETPPENRLVQYGIFSSTVETFSQISVDKIIADGSTTGYELSRAPFEQQPSSYHTIVTVKTREGYVPAVPAVPGAPADPEYNNGAIIDVTGDGSDFFKREVTTNGVRIMGAGTVGGQTAVPDAWLEKVARMYELFLDPNGAGINESFQRSLIQTLSGDAGTYHAGLPTIQRVARGAGADYTPNFLTDDGVVDWNLTNLFDTHVQNDMVWYLNSTGDGYGDGDIDAQEVIEHVMHTLHMHGLPADNIKLYEFLAADWQSGDLYAAMEEAYDAGKWDPSGYQANPDDWKTIADAFEVAAKEYLYLLNFCMFEYTDLWDGNSLAPEWSDDMRTQAGIQANNPLGYAFHNTYIAPVISKPSLATIRSIFQDGNTPAQDNPALAGASGYVVDVAEGSPAVPEVPGTTVERVLTAGYSEAFTVEENVLEYKMKVWQVPVGSVEGSELKVFLNDRELTFLQEWTYEGAGSFNRNISADAQPGSTIILQSGVAAAGDELKVFVLSSGEYRFGYFDSANDFVDTSGKQIPAVLTPVIENGQITSVTVVSGGRGYNVDSGISASSDAGIGAQFTIEVDEVGTIISVTVIEAGSNYDDNTTLNVEIVPIPAVIFFDETFPVDSVIKVYQFSNHNGLGIERERYQVVQQTQMTVGTKGYYDYRNLTNNFVDLRSSAISVNFVWISVNGKWLTPTADYILRENKKRIQFITPLNDYDVVDIMQFAAPPVSNRFGWRQFKDMLNRTTYLRLSSEDEHKLSAPLRWYDRTIQVSEGYDRLPEPNSKTPGVIFIEGERIEFFRREGNILKQLRRGTLGTGVKDEYTAETVFYHQGADSILPYRDEEDRYKVISGSYTDTSKIYPNSSTDITVDSITYSFNNNTVFPVRVPGTYDQVATITGSGFRPGVKALMQDQTGEIRELEKISSTTTEIKFYTETMSVGAYDLVILNPKETAPALRAEEYLVLPKYLPYVQILVPYNPEAFTDVVKNPTETGEWYKAPFDEGGIPDEYWQALNIEVFANGKRLRKTPTKVYDVTRGPDSPDADIDIEADYAVNKNEGAYVRLTTPPEANTTLTIIRKLGTEWRELDTETSSKFKPLGESNTEIATFLRGKTINLPR